MANKRKRDYNNDFSSVTQVLDQLRKPGLEAWFRMNTPEYIAQASQKGKNIGTDTHTAIENYINTGSISVDTEYPTEVTTALNSFVLFRKDYPEIKLKQSELKLTSEIYKFNGTLDLMAEIEGVLIVGDWKTGEAKEEEQPKIYDEYIYQVSAYVKLYNEVNNTNIDRAFIVSLAKDKVAYNIKFIEKEEIEGSFNEVFLSALRIINYKKGIKNGKV